jgi:oligoendopeptidase F
MTTEQLLALDWPQLDAYVQELLAQKLDAQTVAGWLKGWSDLNRAIEEIFARLYVGVTADTTDADMDARFNAFMDGIYPKALEANQALKMKLLDSGLEPEGFDLPLKRMRAEVDLFRAQNLPLLAEEQKLSQEYNKIISAQTVQWEGQEVTLIQLRPVYLDTDRTRRERAWRASAERQLADRAKINDLWGRLLGLRLQLAANAGRPDYRAYRWQEMLRFDYTPEDAARFRQAILETVVPAAARIYERRRQRLGVQTLRPWDLMVDPDGRPALQPYQRMEELTGKTSVIFHHVDEQLGDYFDVMQRESLLDLDNRKNKAPGGYCTSFPYQRKPFIFANSVGLHDDVQTLLHEGGHALHDFESSRLPYIQQLQVPMEFAEVASMGMELLALPYIERSSGGFYTPAEANRARAEHIEELITFWPYMAVVDAFQDWVYQHSDQAADPRACDQAWAREWERFMVGQDWSGLEEEKLTGWHRKLHIHTSPFYYIEYGLAQLGAIQVWANSLQDRAGAVASYRRALALGGTASLPELFRTAGARLAFDSALLGELVTLVERELESVR